MAKPGQQVRFHLVTFSGWHIEKRVSSSYDQRVLYNEFEEYLPFACFIAKQAFPLSGHPLEIILDTTEAAFKRVKYPKDIKMLEQALAKIHRNACGTLICPMKTREELVAEDNEIEFSGFKIRENKFYLGQQWICDSDHKFDLIIEGIEADKRFYPAGLSLEECSLLSPDKLRFTWTRNNDEAISKFLMESYGVKFLRGHSKQFSRYIFLTNTISYDSLCKLIKRHDLTPIDAPTDEKIIWF